MKALTYRFSRARGNLSFARAAIEEQRRAGVCDIGYLLHIAKLSRLVGRFFEAERYAMEAEDAARAWGNGSSRIDSLVMTLGARAFILLDWSLAIRDPSKIQLKKDLRRRAGEKGLEALRETTLINWNDVEKERTASQGQSALIEEMTYLLEVLPSMFGGDPDLIDEAVDLIRDQMREDCLYCDSTVYRLLSRLLLSCSDERVRPGMVYEAIFLCSEGLGIQISTDFSDFGDNFTSFFVKSLQEKDMRDQSLQRLVGDVVNGLWILGKEDNAVALIKAVYQKFRYSRFRWLLVEFLRKSNRYSDALILVQEVIAKKDGVFQNHLSMAHVLLECARLNLNDKGESLVLLQMAQEQLSEFRKKIGNDKINSLRYIRYHCLVAFVWQFSADAAFDTNEFRSFLLQSKRFLKTVHLSDVSYLQRKDLWGAQEIVSRF